MDSEFELSVSGEFVELTSFLVPDLYGILHHEVEHLSLPSEAFLRLSVKFQRSRWIVVLLSFRGCRD